MLHNRIILIRLSNKENVNFFQLDWAEPSRSSGIEYIEGASLMVEVSKAWLETVEMLDFDKPTEGWPSWISIVETLVCWTCSFYGKRNGSWTTWKRLSDFNEIEICECHHLLTTHSSFTCTENGLNYRLVCSCYRIINIQVCTTFLRFLAVDIIVACLLLTYSEISLSTSLLQLSDGSFLRHSHGLILNELKVNLIWRSDQQCCTIVERYGFKQGKMMRYYAIPFLNRDSTVVSNAVQR